MDKKKRNIIIGIIASLLLVGAIVCVFFAGSIIGGTDDYYAKGKTLLENGNYEDAVGAFTTALEHNNTDAKIYVGRGDAYLAMKRFEEALSDYRAALETDLTVISAYLGIYKVYRELEQLNSAILALKAGLQIEPDNELLLPELNTLEKTVELEYVNRFICTQSNNVVRTFFADYNGDGLSELIVFSGVEENDSGENVFKGFVYYVTNDKIEKIGHSSDISPIGISLNGSDAPAIVKQGNRALLVCNGVFATSSPSYVFTCVNGNPKVTRCGGHLTCYDGGFVVEQSTLDGVISKADFAAGNYSGMVRTLKPYWYYWDSKESKLKEYGAIEISREQFLQLDGAQEILTSITKGKIHNILYRSNGIITINIIEECDGIEKNDSYSVTHLILECNKNSVTQSKKFTSSEGGGSGYYRTALNPDVATYPSGFDAQNAVLPTPAADAETALSIEILDASEDTESIYNQFLEASNFYYNWAVLPYFLDEDYNGGGPMNEEGSLAPVQNKVINSTDALRTQCNLRFSPELTERLLSEDIKPEDRNGVLYIDDGEYMPEGSFHEISDHSVERVSDNEYMLTITAYYPIDAMFSEDGSVTYYTYKIKCTRSGNRWIFCDSLEGQTDDSNALYFK